MTTTAHPAAHRFRPTPGELAMVRFLVPVAALRTRLLLAGGLLLAGLALWWLVPWVGVLGLPLMILGHVFLAVRSQTTAPGGATPRHEEIWVPVEDDWLRRVEELEERGERWDVTPWELSNRKGCVAFVAVLALSAALGGAASALLDPTTGFRVATGAALLVAPLWLSGWRTTWNPSELRKKGKALELAREVAQAEGGDDFDAVPMLALRQGARGSYPVDARLMLRPARDDGSGFLGVQVQVAMNNVQGTDYPYLYAVVLGKKGFRLPQGGSRKPWDGWRVKMVYERSEDQEVTWLVIRQHADNRGGWHTKPAHIREIVARALVEGRRAWEENRPS